MVLGPLDSTVEVGKQAAACERCCHAYVLEEVGKPSAFREGAHHKIFPLCGDAVMRLQQDFGAGTVDFGDALEVHDHVRNILALHRLEMECEIFRRAEEQRPFQLQHEYCGAVVGKDFHEPRLARLDRKSTRLNSSHPSISYAVFCLKK